MNTMKPRGRWKYDNVVVTAPPVVAITVGVLSVAVGIGIPVFYETQIDNANKRDNRQPCFPCNGSGA
ncbi:protein disulfide-isomerase LQY1-like, partial [Trifolium pratense]